MNEREFFDGMEWLVCRALLELPRDEAGCPSCDGPIVLFERLGE